MMVSPLQSPTKSCRVDPAASGWSSRRHTPRSSAGLSSLVLLSLALFVPTSRGQLDPVENFCRRFGHQTAVIDSKLYIDGGLLDWNPISQYPSNYSNRGLLYQDLELNGQSGMPQLYANLTKNDSIPDVSGGILWADDVNKRFYLFGGEFYEEPPTSFILYGYDAIYNVWDSYGAPPTGVNSVSYGAGVALSDRGEGYYYGGWLSNNSVPGWSGPSMATTGLIKYEMDQNSWTNNTGPDDVRRAEGAMVYIPASDGGMLIYFGGIIDPFLNGSYVGQPMNEIFVYDVLSSKWYTQNATGTIPGMRGRFCAGATWAPDQSSYNIYLYGGAGMPPDTAGWDDVYVLTLPSFTWIKMFPTDGNVTGPVPHHSLTCNVINNAQMLIIGGTFPLTEDCDAPQQWGTHNVDMGEQNPSKALWQLFLPNLTTYQVPDPIVSVVGGAASGGATVTAPAKGFTDPDLSVLMTRKASVATRTPTRAIPSATGASGGSGPLSTGAIIGVAVGGGIALIAALVGICCFIRRHRRRHYRPPPGSGHAYSGSDVASPWSPHTPGTMLASSPFANRPAATASPRPPAELSATGTNVWTGPDGVTYELTPSPHDGGTTLGSGGGGGHGVPALYDLPQAKVDDQGRIWIPQVTLMPLAAPPSAGRTPRESGNNSPHHSHDGIYPQPRAYHPQLRHTGTLGYSPVPASSPPHSPPRRVASPQELAGDLYPPDDDDRGREEGEYQPQWDGARGRPGVHQTYYHP